MFLFFLVNYWLDMKYLLIILVFCLLQISWWWFGNLSSTFFEFLCLSRTSSGISFNWNWTFYWFSVNRFLLKMKILLFIFSGDTKRRIVPSIVVLIVMFILQVLFAVFDARDCKFIFLIEKLEDYFKYFSLRCFPLCDNS